MPLQSPARAAATRLELGDFHEEHTPSAVWTTYHPTWRDNATDWILDFFGDKPPLATRARIERLMGNAPPITSDFVSPVDFTPAGAVFSAEEAYRKFNLGNYSGAALDAAGAVPGSALSMLGKGAKAAKAEIGGGLGFAAPYVGRAGGAGGEKIMDMYLAAQAGSDDLPSRALAKVREMFKRAGFNMGLDGAEKTAAAEVGSRPSRVTAENITRASDLRAALKDKADIRFDPGKYPQRPFRKDYPNGAEITKDGKLAKDIDGREIAAEYVAGRVYPGAPDIALGERELGKVIQRITHGIHRHEMPERGYWLVPRKPSLRGNIGITLLKEGWPHKVGIANDLSEADVKRVLAHETGHVLHETGKRERNSGRVVRDVSPDGIEADMLENYHSNKTGHYWPVRLTKRGPSLIDPATGEIRPRYGPREFGYREEELWQEYVAEGLATYMTAPNTIKTLWPETAARLRAFVNEHEELKKVIQLNGLAGPAVIGLAGYRRDDSHRGRNTHLLEEY